MIKKSLREFLQDGQLKAKTKTSRKTFLTEKFNLRLTTGLTTGIKEDPEKVAREMRVVKLHNGQRRFGIEEFLIPQQILSTFPRHNRKHCFSISRSI